MASKKPYWKSTSKPDDEAFVIDVAGHPSLVGAVADAGRFRPESQVVPRYGPAGLCRARRWAIMQSRLVGRARFFVPRLNGVRRVTHLRKLDKDWGLLGAAG